MVRAARKLLSAITKVLLIADKVIVKQLLTSKDKVGNYVPRTEGGGDIPGILIGPPTARQLYAGGGPQLFASWDISFGVNPICVCIAYFRALCLLNQMANFDKAAWMHCCEEGKRVDYISVTIVISKGNNST